jgi:hypothetical protein
MKALVHDQGSPCGICGGQGGTGTSYSPSSSVFLSVSFHCYSIFTHVSSEGWTMGPLAAQFHKDIFSPHCNNNIQVLD